MSETQMDEAANQAAHRRIAEQRLDSFYRHGMSGMGLEADRPALTTPRSLRPLVRRCECGRPISANRHSCLACHIALLRTIADGIPSQEALDELLAQSPDPVVFLNAIRPYLSFQAT